MNTCFHKIIITLCSLFCLTLGSSVITGWYLHNVHLIQILPSLVPMQFNTALGFLITGFGLFFLLISSRKTPTIFIGILLTLFAGLTLVQYVFDTNFFIDQLFFQHYIKVNTSHIGRMAPNTALAFILTGINLLTSKHIKKNSFFIYLNILTSLLVFMLGFSALFGYFFGISTTYAWASLTRMALHTATGFVFAGIALSLFSFSSLRTKQLEHVIILPTIILIVFILSSVLIFVNLSIEESIESPHTFLTRLRYTILFISLLNGVLVATIAQIWLITTNKQKKELTHRSEKLEDDLTAQKIALDQITDGWWDWNLDTNEEYLSPKFKAMFGYRDHELPNQAESWQKIIFQEDLQYALEAYEKHIKEQVPYKLAVRYQHKNGSTVWVLCRGQAIKDNDGHYYRMIGTHTDLTPLKEAEREILQERNKLKHANRELKQFTYIASHDLQAPLRYITSYIELLKEKIVFDQDSEEQQYINNITNSAKNMQTLIDDLLSFSRIINTQIQFEEVNLEEIVNNLLKIFSSKLQQHNIKVTIGQLPTITANKTQIKQLMQNLLGNALKFSTLQDNPQVTISASAHKQFWQCCVKDNGIGIEEKYHDKIFQAFQKLHAQSEFSGSGIGLAICRKIVENHRGKIWIKSSANKGAAFYFSIPKDL